MCTCSVGELAAAAGFLRSTERTKGETRTAGTNCLEEQREQLVRDLEGLRKFLRGHKPRDIPDCKYRTLPQTFPIEDLRFLLQWL
jgi:hypothetical protein